MKKIILVIVGCAFMGFSPALGGDEPGKARAPRGYQDLRPGQAADPASPLPPPPDSYPIRSQRTDGPWLGVTERELPDGHAVEVHTNGDPRLLGQEVISRPSGHEVYRHFSGRPDAPRSGADPAQDQRNREDLSAIVKGGQGPFPPPPAAEETAPSFP